MDVTTASAPTAADLSLFAPWSTRFGAWLVDFLLLCAVLLLLSLGSNSTAAAFVVLLIPPIYFTVCNGSRGGQTIGKRMVGISVRDNSSLGRIGYVRAFLRWLVTLFFWLFLLVPGILDSLWPLGDGKRQTWHDKVVGSVVIRL